MKPTWKHDCDACEFLGMFDKHDLYYCSSTMLPTIIARFGSDGPEYKSGMAFKDADKHLREAYRRAAAKGLVNAA